MQPQAAPIGLSTGGPPSRDTGGRPGTGEGEARIGQEVRIRVVTVEPSAGRLGLSMRRPDDDARAT